MHVFKAHIIVTRPVLQSDGLVEQLSNAGYSVCQLPMLDILPLQKPQAIAQAREQFLNLERLSSDQMKVGRKIKGQAENDLLQRRFDLAIFISTNAVKHAAQFCLEQCIRWPPTLDCLGMGETTTQAIEEQGWQLLDTCAEGFGSARPGLGKLRDETTESLLQGEWLHEIKGQRIAIIRGVGGRELLAEQLRARHANVEYIEVYERSIPSYDSNSLRNTVKPLFNDINGAFDDIDEKKDVSAGFLHGLPILLFASGETVLNFCHVVKPLSDEYRFMSAQCVVPSERVASIARSQGFRRVTVAEGASDQAFLHAVLALNE